MNFGLTREQELVRQMVREFAVNEVKPIAAEIDETERFPMENVKKMGELGMMGIPFPKELGGAGGDVFKFVNNSREKFDFIFADPPYALKDLASIPELIFQNELLKEDGLFVLEHGKENNFEDHPHFIEIRIYGSVNFSLFR